MKGVEIKIISHLFHMLYTWPLLVWHFQFQNSKFAPSTTAFILRNRKFYNSDGNYDTDYINRYWSGFTQDIYT